MRLPDANVSRSAIGIVGRLMIWRLVILVVHFRIVSGGCERDMSLRCTAQEVDGAIATRQGRKWPFRVQGWSKPHASFTTRHRPRPSRVYHCSAYQPSDKSAYCPDLTPSAGNMMQAYRKSTQAATDMLAMPTKYGKLYEEFIVSNASSIGSIESALRSLTYIIPGRFRDAEIASESCATARACMIKYYANRTNSTFRRPAALPLS